MPQFNLTKPRHYLVEMLTKDEECLSIETRFKSAEGLHEWAIAYMINNQHVYRMQVWRGGTDLSNPDIDQDWVNTYCQETFEEFGQQSIAISRLTKNIHQPIGGSKETVYYQNPTVYCLAGNWHKATIRKGQKKKRVRLNLEAIG
jgi:hypothetical protein